MAVYRGRSTWSLDEEAKPVPRLLRTLGNRFGLPIRLRGAFLLIAAAGIAGYLVVISVSWWPVQTALRLAVLAALWLLGIVAFALLAKAWRAIVAAAAVEPSQSPSN